MRPALLAAACSGVALALANVAATSLAFQSRFADAFQWAIAAAPSLGIAEAQMRIALCPDTLARAVAAFAHGNRTGKVLPPNSSLLSKPRTAPICPTRRIA